jgi:nicotinamide-nucleotide amidase
LINEMFLRRGLKQNRLNDRQAMVPEGALVLDNPHGTAPGLYLPADPLAGSPHLFVLPGPPRELKPMYETLVAPAIAALLGADRMAPEWLNFKIFGVGESSLATALEPDFEKIPDLEVGYCARLGEVDLRLIGASAAVNEAATLVRAGFAHEIVTESEDAIEQVILELLRGRGETVSTAESCTGGYLASTITDVAGSSEIFQRGYVTYSNEAKTEILGVPRATLEAHGAVSNETVEAMASGCLAASGADHAIAVSGIAGPGGGSEAKPVGTVHIALASKEGGVFSKHYFFPVERISFKMRVTRQALDLLRRRLLGFPLD